MLIARYFAKEQATIGSLEAETASVAQQLEEMAEEHGGEEGLLTEAKNEKDKITRASITSRVKEIKGRAELADELKVLKDYLALIEKEAEANDRVKDVQRDLEAKVGKTSCAASMAALDEPAGRRGLKRMRKGTSRLSR